MQRWAFCVYIRTLDRVMYLPIIFRLLFVVVVLAVVVVVVVVVVVAVDYPCHIGYCDLVLWK
jgi:hypothetical protein